MTVNTTTGEIVDRPTYGEVRQSIETTKSHLERAAEQVVWQIEEQVWTVLGYGSWDEMREAEYKGAAVIVPAADRPELSSRLRATGMTQREIGTTLGVADTTVRRDLNQHMSVEPPAITNSRGQTRPATYTKTPAAPASTSADDAEAEPEAGGSLPVRQPPASSADPLGEFIEGSADLQDARYLENYTKAWAGAGGFLKFDAERIGLIGDDNDITTLQQHIDSTQRFLDRVKSSRSGLRVIKGGRA